MAGAESRFVVGITGASGAAYALRVLDILLGRGCEVHLVITEFGKRLLAEEADIRGFAAAELAERMGCGEGELIVHPNKDVGAVVASGSFLHSGMVVVPCSSTSLGKIAGGVGDDLLARAAAVCLKERRRLILVHREMPLSLVDIENYRRVALAGGIMCPANPGFYLKPREVGDVVDFVAGKVLDLLGVEHGLKTRWPEDVAGD